MQDLFEISSKEVNNKNIETVSARDLWEYLGSKQDFSTWIKNRIQKYDFKENIDYIRFHLKVEGDSKGYGNKTLKEYHISISMAKELSIVENNGKGREARLYLINFEEKGKDLISTFQNDPFIALRMKQINMEKDIQDIKKDAGKNDKRINLLEAKIDQNIDYVTIRGYCNINKIKLSRNSMGRLGMKCVKKSREMGVEYSQVKDEREGHVNIYRSDIIDIVYNQ